MSWPFVGYYTIAIAFLVWIIDITNWPILMIIYSIWIIIKLMERLKCLK